mmetsp:Transcript_117302/g.343549  ORF Transcript_117302/g.343549 Transcript_117302/m.343549 type:complete len:109 (-) Transcript_117302:191-517(-)
MAAVLGVVAVPLMSLVVVALSSKYKLRPTSGAAVEGRLQGGRKVKKLGHVGPFPNVHLGLATVSMVVQVVPERRGPQQQCQDDGRAGDHGESPRTPLADLPPPQLVDA